MMQQVYNFLYIFSGLYISGKMAAIIIGCLLLFAALWFSRRVKGALTRIIVAVIVMAAYLVALHFFPVYSYGNMLLCEFLAPIIAIGIAWMSRTVSSIPLKVFALGMGLLMYYFPNIVNLLR